jgi:hypothetical protein
MKIYRLDWFDPMEGACIAWAATAAEAEKAKAAILVDYDTSDVAIERIDFPGTVAELVDWLNVELTRDNG